jgi:hypothetical protein
MAYPAGHRTNVSFLVTNSSTVRHLNVKFMMHDMLRLTEQT